MYVASPERFLTGVFRTVAATGIPDYRKDHAVAMVHFARDIVYATRKITKQLEVVLGPQTCDLSIRIGVHSGMSCNNTFSIVVSCESSVLTKV